MPGSISNAIISHLNRNKITSVFELSQLLGISKSAVQYHLKKMLQEGTIEIYPLDEKSLEVKKPSLSEEGRGRPTFFYCLSSKTFESNLDHLSDHLLSLFLNLDEKLSTEERVKQLAQYMLKKPDSYVNMIAALNDLISQLNQHHYRASWEASQNGPRIIFRSCPYSKILNNHSEICLMDLYVLEYFTNTSFYQISKININMPGSTSCVFQITAPHK